MVLVVGLAVPNWRLGEFSLSVETLARSYLILPGWGFPMLGVGWTLEYEMVFYGFVAVLIATGLLRAGPCAGFAFLLAGLALVGCIVGPRETGSALLYHICSPYMFAFGLGWLLHASERMDTPARLRSLALFGAVVAVAAWLGQGWSDHLLLRIVAMAVVFMAALGLRVTLNADTLLNRAMSKLGDASYALYLSHWFVLSASGKVLDALDVPASLDPLARVAGLAASLAVAVVVYNWAERPLDRVLRHNVVGVRRAVAVPP